MKYFKDMPVGSLFICNGNLVRKVSTRTGHLIDYGQTFYFQSLLHCSPVASSE